MLCWTSSHQYERVRAITPNLTHLLPIHTWDLVTLTSHMTHRREKMANWAQFGHFHLGVYSLLWPAVSILMGVSYFEGTENLLCYTSCTLTTLHCSKVLFLQCYHMKRYNKIYKKNVRGVLTSVRYCNCIHSHAAKYILAYRRIRGYMDSSVAATKRCI